MIYNLNNLKRLKCFSYKNLKSKFKKFGTKLELTMSGYRKTSKITFDEKWGFTYQFIGDLKLLNWIATAPNNNNSW